MNKLNMISNGTVTCIVISLVVIKSALCEYKVLNENGWYVQYPQKISRFCFVNIKGTDNSKNDIAPNSTNKRFLRHIDRILYMKKNMVAKENSKLSLFARLLSSKRTHNLHIPNRFLLEPLPYLSPLHKNFHNSAYLHTYNVAKETVRDDVTETNINEDDHAIDFHDNKNEVLNDTSQTTTIYQNETISKVTGTEDYYTSKLLSSEDFLKRFAEALDRFQRKFFQTTFTKLSAISPPERRENGISFVQSALFLYLMLMTLSTEVDRETRAEIEMCIGNTDSDSEKIDIIKQILDWLPKSDDDLKFRWASRFVFGPGLNISQKFKDGVASALQLRIERFNGTETPEMLAKSLNHMVELDSGGAMHNTFDEDELSASIQGIAVNTLYLRGRWRASPTLLNGTHELQDAGDNAPRRLMRMIRINDIMMYADLTEWDAEAIELSYATPGLTLLVLLPRNQSLRSLVNNVTKTNLQNITARMHSVRIAATFPLYTLRMTLLLPSKLQEIGISRLVNNRKAGELRLSHAVQRIMFWAEAGRNAFKDDGIEWDEPPEIELMVDRPYLFFVRWHNITIINGNFVL